jgi:hypothetical protein
MKKYYSNYRLNNELKTTETVIANNIEEAIQQMDNYPFAEILCKTSMIKFDPYIKWFEEFDDENEKIGSYMK